MAISKILCIKQSGKYQPARHLKAAIEYISAPEKTGGGKYVAGHNCIGEYAYNQMMATKKHFDKRDMRQGYHIILSFVENEVTPDTAFEIVGKFVGRYLGNKYEAIYSVHDNTDHVHGHIIFNSVSCLNGLKFRYEKGDWEKYIQPIVNDLCTEYGLSTISVEQTEDKVWNSYKDGRFVWRNMIRRDVDTCILQADDPEQFIKLLEEKGYEVKNNKYLTVKPQGMYRYCRLKSLGDDYTEQRIAERIIAETMTEHEDMEEKYAAPKLYKMKRICVVKRAALTPLQKKYYAKLYRTGQLKKRPYSQAWKYRNDIKKMKLYYEQYMFLVHHNVSSVADLITVCDNLAEKKAQLNKDRRNFCRRRERVKPLFEKAQRMRELIPAYDSYLNGDTFFEDEYHEYERLSGELKEQGYTLLEVDKLKEHYINGNSEYAENLKRLSGEIKIGNTIISEIQIRKDIVHDEQTVGGADGHIETDFQQTDKERNNDDKQQPKR